jgi:hypothetical protein
MFFIHDTSSISPQKTFLQDTILASSIDELNEPVNNTLFAIEPMYDGIPPGILRRMGRAVRLGVGAALPILHKNTLAPNGIIIGTSMGGMEDCIKFLNQIIEYNEGTLTPTNFVQSTPNAIAGQLGLMSKNKGYNITHVHRGFSFENALIDAAMCLEENAGNTYLVGAVDEISGYNYNIEKLDGSYKADPCTIEELYNTDSAGSIAGEGSAMFLVSNDPANAKAALQAIHIFHTTDPDIVTEQLGQFLEKYLPGNTKPDLLLTGENGDNRLQHFYHSCELVAGNDVPVARFKHLCGEHPTAIGFGCWLATEIINTNKLPANMIKKGTPANIERLLMYNNYKGIQHSFMLLEKVK